MKKLLLTLILFVPIFLLAQEDKKDTSRNNETGTF